jgi:putative sugar O-methyltransferase
VLDDLKIASEAMMTELERRPEYLPSAFWRGINAKNIAMLEASGLENFKRTLSQNYYSWLITKPWHPQFVRLMLAWLAKPDGFPLRARLTDTDGLRTTISPEPVRLSAFQKTVHKLFVAFVWRTAAQNDPHGLGRRLTEPTAGNPFGIRDGDLLITQDLANSIVECNVIADAVASGASGRADAPRVAEVGAGSGRLAHAFAATQPGTYYIFDIPPALAVAQWYLGQVLGQENVFSFRPFERLADVEAEMRRAKVVMLTANQIELFPDGYFDVVSSISTLPEMRKDQIDLYLGHFRRLARGSVFLKQWISWTNPADNVSLGRDDIEFGAGWTLALDRRDPINGQFYNRVWRKTT